MGPLPPPWTPERAFTTFATGPWAVITLIAELLALGWYFRSVKLFESRYGRRWPLKRKICFAGGIACCAIAWQSSVPVFTMNSFDDHMVQHIALMIAGPQLLALSAPVTLAMQTTSRERKVKILRFLRSKLWRGIAHPLPANAFNYGIMYWFFLGGGIIVCMDHAPLMDFVNVCFLFFGCLVWWPILSPDWIGRKRFPFAVRLVLAVGGMPLDSFLAIALLGTEVRSVDPQLYTLAQTTSGASVFWILSGLFTGVSATILIREWMRREQRASKVVDTQLEEKSVVAGGGVYAGWTGEARVEEDGTIRVPWAEPGEIDWAHPPRLREKMRHGSNQQLGTA
jgi:cytochrome c oxidase assembly factor CtaG